MEAIAVGERFRRNVVVSAEEVRRFAAATGDKSPIHRDADFARRTRFGDLVVTGGQLISLMTGLVATHFYRPSGRIGLGLDFSCVTHGAVKAGQEVEISWEVTAVQEKPSLSGTVVTLKGLISDGRGRTFVSAESRTLVTDHP
ncbi:MAG TPA: MaoC/PaaZ C-terminal domain-containing protein [Syntrophales bacterium]|jgi:acyl dehydratase|nr:MaoC/PaaZ C-terminal domain-containing protein [Syntrophales bacterium]